MLDLPSPTGSRPGPLVRQAGMPRHRLCDMPAAGPDHHDSLVPPASTDRDHPPSPLASRPRPALPRPDGCHRRRDPERHRSLDSTRRPVPGGGHGDHRGPQMAMPRRAPSPDRLGPPDSTPDTAQPQLRTLDCRHVLRPRHGEGAGGSPRVAPPRHPPDHPTHLGTTPPGSAAGAARRSRPAALPAGVPGAGAGRGDHDASGSDRAVDADARRRRRHLPEATVTDDGGTLAGHRPGSTGHPAEGRAARNARRPSERRLIQTADHAPVWEVRIHIDKDNAVGAVQAHRIRYLPASPFTNRVMQHLPYPSGVAAYRTLFAVRRALLRRHGVTQVMSARRDAAEAAMRLGMDPGTVLNHRPGSRSTPGYTRSLTTPALAVALMQAM